jgi:hypothetical protein
MVGEWIEKIRSLSIKGGGSATNINPILKMVSYSGQSQKKNYQGVKER